MEKELASLQQLNAGLQRDLQRYQEREDLLEQAREPDCDDGPHFALTVQHEALLEHAKTVPHSWKLCQRCPRLHAILWSWPFYSSALDCLGVGLRLKRNQ
jgi:hypothetical protein